MLLTGNKRPELVAAVSPDGVYAKRELPDHVTSSPGKAGGIQVGRSKR